MFTTAKRTFDRRHLLEDNLLRHSGFALVELFADARNHVQAAFQRVPHLQRREMTMEVTLCGARPGAQPSLVNSWFFSAIDRNVFETTEKKLGHFSQNI